MSFIGPINLDTDFARVASIVTNDRSSQRKGETAYVLVFADAHSQLENASLQSYSLFLSIICFLFS